MGPSSRYKMHMPCIIFLHIYPYKMQCVSHGSRTNAVCVWIDVSCQFSQVGPNPRDHTGTDPMLCYASAYACVKAFLSDVIKLASTSGTDPMLCYACVKAQTGTYPMLCYACVKATYVHAA